MPSRRFEGRNIFITGAGSGFGRATALAFAREGAKHLFLADLRSDGLEEVEVLVRKAGAVAHLFKLDIADTQAIDDAFAKVSAIDPQLHVMVSNAAYFGLPTPILELSDEAWRREIDTSLCGAFTLATRAARQMVSGKVAGSILFTASISATSATVGLAGYCTTKAAIVMLARSLAADLATYGIRVNCVSPGPADTPRAVEILGQARVETLRKGNASIPLKRLASADDIAEAFIYLASDEARYITGQNLVVDGGLTLNSDALASE
jgi:3-oxoacyl-[acyl-carrier protein] reductase